MRTLDAIIYDGAAEGLNDALDMLECRLELARQKVATTRGRKLEMANQPAVADRTLQQEAA